MLFTLFEFINDISSNAKLNTIIIRGMKVVVIYFGVITDYYFWIFVFLIFAMKIVRMSLEKKNIGTMIYQSCEYVCPVILGILTFYWQISQTEGWFNVLKDKYIFRTNGQVEEGLSLFKRFCSVYVCGEKIRGILLLGLGLIFAVTVIISLIKRKMFCRVLLKPGINVLIVSIIAPVMQILFLKNHSINHEFSMVKVGWIIALFPVLYAGFACWKNRNDINRCINENGRGASVFCLRVLIMMMLIGYVMKMPMATQEFLEKSSVKVNYEMEKRLNEITDYDDMCFSYDMQIYHNESTELSLSEKCVYKVKDSEELYSSISQVVGVDKIYFIIDKWIEDEPENNKQFEEMLLDREEPIYEDDRYYIVNLQKEKQY